MGAHAAMSASARIDVHSEFHGTLVSPRVSLLLTPAPAWTARVSVGGGAFAPTPFTEETDDSGLRRLAPLTGLKAERATASADVTWARGRVEVSATLFGSIVDDAVQLATLAQIAVVGARVSRRPDQRAPTGAATAPNCWCATGGGSPGRLRPTPGRGRPSVIRTGRRGARCR